MIKQSKVKFGVAAALAILIALAIVAGVYSRRSFTAEKVPRPGDQTYADLVSAFYSGVALPRLDVDAAPKTARRGAASPK